VACCSGVHAVDGISCVGKVAATLRLSAQTPLPVVLLLPVTTEAQIAFATNRIEAQILVRKSGWSVTPSYFSVGDVNAVHVPHFLPCVKLQ